MKPTESTSTAGQYTRSRNDTSSGMMSATTCGPARTSGTSTIPMIRATM